MEDTTGYDVYLGLDVGKTAHHGCALLTDGTKVHDKPLPQDEAQLTALFDQLKTHGRVLLIVDQRRHHRRPAGRGGPRHRLRCGLPAWPGDAKSRRPVPRPVED